MTDTKFNLGKQGESIAKDFYLKNNFKIRDTNWRFGHLEIDIIAEDDSTIIFCEVKTRSSTVMGTPEQFVTRQKQLNLIRAANAYIIRSALQKEVRFDIISIVQKESSFDIHHIPAAFSPRW